MKTIFEKSVSKSQQRFFGLVRAVQKGDVPKSKVSKDLAKVADNVEPKEVKKYAETKTKGLPEKVKKESKLSNIDKYLILECECIKSKIEFLEGELERAIEEKDKAAITPQTSDYHFIGSVPPNVKTIDDYISWLEKEIDIHKSIKDKK